MNINDHIDLEIRTAVEGGFILGTSKLNQHYLLSDADLANDALFEWQSIIDQVLSITFKRGVDTYTGAYALPLSNVGIMHVRTVNRQLDPNTNKYLQPRSKIRLIHKNNGNPVTIFQGRVDNLFVDYRSDVQKPLIQFDVMDPIAELQNSTLLLSGLGTSADQTWTERINEIMTNGKQETRPKSIHGGGTTKHGYWEDNLSVWEALELANNTEGGFIYFDRAGTMQCYASESIPNEPSIIEFSNELNAPVGYKNISIDFNTDSVINDIQVSNKWGYIKYEFDADENSLYYGTSVTTQVVEDKTIALEPAIASKNKYGVHALKVDTNFHLSPDQSQVEAWGQKILSKWKEATTIVKEIEWDAFKNPVVAGAAEILDQVDIVYNTEAISFNKTLTVIGIQHEINYDANTWKVKYILFPRSRFI